MERSWFVNMHLNIVKKHFEHNEISGIATVRSIEFLSGEFKKMAVLLISG
jgi:hypothetical protein